MAKFMDETAERAFHDAVAAIEKASSAEVVVAVRPHANLWMVPTIGLGMIAAAVALAYALFAEREFSLWAIFSLPALAGTAVALLVLLPPIYRVLLPARLRDDHVVQAARATFVERGVHSTRARTGVLVYVSLLERRLLLVGDLAFERALGDDLLDRWERELGLLIRKGGKAVADALAKHASEIGRALPHRADDTNELPDAVSTVAPRGLRKVRGVR